MIHWHKNFTSLRPPKVVFVLVWYELKALPRLLFTTKFFITKRFFDYSSLINIFWNLQPIICTRDKLLYPWKRDRKILSTLSMKHPSQIICLLAHPRKQAQWILMMVLFPINLHRREKEFLLPLVLWDISVPN